jgi:protein-tyrosine phosphatase
MSAAAVERPTALTAQAPSLADPSAAPSQHAAALLSRPRLSLRSVLRLVNLFDRSPQLAPQRRSGMTGSAGQPATPILKSRLYIGSRMDGMVAKLNNPRGFTHVLCLEGSTKYPEERSNIRFLHAELDDDGGDNLLAFVEKVRNFIDTGVRRGKVLVHCTNGTNRAPAIVIWYLMTYHAMPFQEAKEAVASRRRGTNVCKSYITQLKEMHECAPHE